MAEYIQKEAFLKETEHMARWGLAFYAFREAILDFPAADVVAVVRCRDCKYRGDEISCPMCKTRYCNDGDGYIDVCVEDDTVDHDFCSYGERRGEDGNQENLRPMRGRD